MILTKSRGWCYEQEYRAVRGAGIEHEEQRLVRERGLRWDGQVVELLPQTIVGITIGVSMPNSLAMELTVEIADRRPELQVWKAAVGRTQACVRADPRLMIEQSRPAAI